MQNAVVAIDKWKLKIFKKALDNAGYSYIYRKGLTDDTFFLMVSTESVQALRPLIEKANLDCAIFKRKQKLN